MDTIKNDQNIVKDEALWQAVAQKKQTKGLVHMLDAALEQGDAQESMLLMLAGLETPEVSKWVAARIQALLKQGGLDISTREMILRRLPSDLPKSQSIEAVEAILKDANSETESRRLLTIAHKTLEHSRFSWQLAKDLAMQGDLEEAVKILDEMAERDHKQALIHQTHAELLSMIGQHDRAIEINRQLLLDNPERIDFKRNYLRMLMAAGRTTDLEKELPALLAEHPADWMFASFLHRARVSSNTLKKCFALLSSPNASSDPRYMLHYAASAIAANNLQAARVILPFNIPDEIPYAESFKRAVGHVLKSGIQASERFVDDPTQTFQVVKAGKGKATVVVCLSNSAINFSFLSLGFIDELLAEFDVNVIYLRETRKMLFHNGIKGLGETEAEMLAKIEQLHQELGSSQRIYMGSSLGGYGASRYGHLGNADAVLSFAGPTDIYQFADEAIPKALYVPQFLLMQHIRHQLTADDCQLKPIIAASGIKHFQFYGEQEASDTMQAKNIENLPNVELIPVADATDHFVFGYCVADGRFQQIFSHIISGENTWPRKPH